MKNKAFFIGASLCGLALLFFAVFPLTTGEQLPYRFHEHFYNTLEIARGHIVSNDFSPVWGGVLTGFDGWFDGRSFFAAVYAVLLLSGAAFLFLLFKLLKKLDLPLTDGGKFAVAAFALAFYIKTAVSGTDAALAMPAVLLSALALLHALEKPRVLTGIAGGLAASAMLLTRFDTAGFAITFALVFYFQFNGKEPVSYKQFFALIAGLAIGVLPVAGYWLWEKHTFGAIVPMTVLGWTNAQGSAPWRMLQLLFIDPVRNMIHQPTAIVLVSFPVLLIALTAYHSFPWIKREQTPRDTLFYSMLWFPVFQITALALFSYILVPDYAFYPLGIGAPVALAYAINRISANIKENDFSLAEKIWSAVGLCLTAVGVYTVSVNYDASYHTMTHALIPFAQAHNGRFAMGKGASVAAFAVNKPFIRMDGPAGDSNLQKLLENQADILDALKQYGADLYVAVNLVKQDSGCYGVREPKQNKFGTNKSMQGWLCQTPVAEIQASPALRVQVFAVR